MSQYLPEDWRSLTQELQPQLSCAQGKAASCLCALQPAGQGHHELDPAAAAGCSSSPGLAAERDLPARAPSAAGGVRGTLEPAFQVHPAPRLLTKLLCVRPCDWEPSWLGNTLGLQMNVCSRWWLCSSAQTLGWGQLLVGDREGVKTLAGMAPVMTLLLSPVPAAAGHSRAWHCLGGCSPGGLRNQLINYCCSSPVLALEGSPHTLAASPWENLTVGCHSYINSLSGFSSLVRWRHQTVSTKLG